MDYFYKPYRQDFVKDDQKFMTFDEDPNEKKQKKWDPITTFILSKNTKKSFQQTIQHLSKRKLRRMVAKAKKKAEHKNTYGLDDMLKKYNKKRQTIVSNGIIGTPSNASFSKKTVGCENKRYSLAINGIVAQVGKVPNKRFSCAPIGGIFGKSFNASESPSKILNKITEDDIRRNVHSRNRYSSTLGNNISMNIVMEDDTENANFTEFVATQLQNANKGIKKPKKNDSFSSSSDSSTFIKKKKKEDVKPVPLNKSAFLPLPKEKDEESMDSENLKNSSHFKINIRRASRSFNELPYTVEKLIKTIKDENTKHQKSNQSKSNKSNVSNILSENKTSHMNSKMSFVSSKKTSNSQTMKMSSMRESSQPHEVKKMSTLEKLNSLRDSDIVQKVYNIRPSYLNLSNIRASSKQSSDISLKGSVNTRHYSKITTLGRTSLAHKTPELKSRSALFKMNTTTPLYKDSATYSKFDGIDNTNKESLLCILEEHDHKEGDNLASGKQIPSKISSSNKSKRKRFMSNDYKRTKTKNENKLSSFNLDKYKAAKKQDSAKSLEESNLSSEGEQEESSKSNDDKSQNNSCSSSSDSSKSSNSNEKISSSSVSHENGHNSSLIKVSEVQKYFPHMEMSHPIAVHNDKQHNKVQVNLPEVMNIPSYSEHLKHKNDVNQSKKSSQITIKSSLKSSSDANTMANASKKKSGNIESQTFSKKISGNIESQTFVIKPSTSITETPVLRRPFIQNNIKEQVHKIMHKEIVNNNDSVKKMQSVGDSSKSPPSAAKSPVIRTAKSPPVPSSRLPLRFKSPFSSIRGLYTRFKSPNPKKTVIGKTIKNSRNNFYNLIFSFSGGGSSEFAYRSWVKKQMKSTDAHHEVSNAMSELNPATNFGLEKTFKIRKVKKRIKNISKTAKVRSKLNSKSPQDRSVLQQRLLNLKSNYMYQSPSNAVENNAFKYTRFNSPEVSDIDAKKLFKTLDRQTQKIRKDIRSIERLLMRNQKTNKLEMRRKINIMYRAQNQQSPSPNNSLGMFYI